MPSVKFILIVLVLGALISIIGVAIMAVIKGIKQPPR